MSDVIEYKCPACGGKLEFNSGSQKMRCPFCESEFDIDSIKDHDNCLENIKEDDMEWETSAGGGAVTVKISGKKEITAVHIDTSVFFVFRFIFRALRNAGRSAAGSCLPGRPI